jgi:hypothetical protein
MSNKKTAPAPSQVSGLPEIDPADMDAVSGGCANCAQGSQASQGGASKLAALIPMLASQAGR